MEPDGCLYIARKIVCGSFFLVEIFAIYFLSLTHLIAGQLGKVRMQNLTMIPRFRKDVANLELQGNKFDFEERNADRA